MSADERHGEFERNAVVEQLRADVAAEAEECGVAEGDLPGPADQDHQRQPDQRVDRRQRAVEVGDLRGADERPEQRGGGEHRTHRRVDARLRRTSRSTLLIRTPPPLRVGGLPDRTTSTASRATNTSSSPMPGGRRCSPGRS